MNKYNLLFSKQDKSALGFFTPSILGNYCNAHLVEIPYTQLDYCSQLWCPLHTGDIQELEMVQRTFLQKTSGLK